MSNISIWPLDRTLSSASTLFQSWPGSNGNDRVLHIPQISKAGDSPADCFMSYQDIRLWWGLTYLQRCSRPILQRHSQLCRRLCPFDWSLCNCYILTLRPSPKMLFQGDTPEGSDTFQSPVIERDRVGGLRLMRWDKVKVSLCHYNHAPEESNLFSRLLLTFGPFFVLYRSRGKSRTQALCMGFAPK